MSYSFNVRAADKADACAKVTAELDKVVASQPIHEADRAQAQTAAEAFTALLGEPGENQEISVSVSGSISKWADGAQLQSVTGAGVSISASILTKIG